MPELSLSKEQREELDRLRRRWSEYRFLNEAEMARLVSHLLGALDAAEARTEEALASYRHLARNCREFEERIIAEKEAGQARSARLETALRQLAQVIDGALGIAEYAIREAIGNTNVAVVRLRLREAREALTPAPLSSRRREGE